MSSSKLNAENISKEELISDSSGYSTLFGISGGLGYFGSFDIVFGGEGDDTHPIGFAVSIGGE